MLVKNIDTSEKITYFLIVKLKLIIINNIN